MPSKLTKKTHRPATAGFGLVELLVSMTIMALVSAVVLVKESSFKGSVVMRNQAYEVAFMIRQAQLLAVGGTDDGTAIDQRFGVRIDRNNNTVTLFSDSSNPVGYNSSDIVIERRQLDSRFSFDRLTTGANTSPQTTTIADVVFERPNFDARVRSGGSYRAGTLHIDIGVDSSDAIRRVEVLSSGSVSVLSN